IFSFFFFFSSRRRHTRSKRDWSSDVCSSDLPRACLLESIDVPPANVSRLGDHFGNRPVDLLLDREVLGVQVNKGDFHDGGRRTEIGRASCRERVEMGEGGGREEETREEE